MSGLIDSSVRSFVTSSQPGEGAACERPEIGSGAAFGTMRRVMKDTWRLNRSGRRKTVNERWDLSPAVELPHSAKRRLEWGNLRDAFRPWERQQIARRPASVRRTHIDRERQSMRQSTIFS